MESKDKKPECLLACEILWDCFPDRELLGGSTLNVAYHLNHLNTGTILLSTIGNDRLGENALRQISEQWRCDTRWIKIIDNKPTGYVEVTLDESGEPSFLLGTPAAWDYIDIPQKAVGNAEAFVYGAVALRGEYNRKSFSGFLDTFNGLTFFDANLRPPHTNPEHVLEFAAKANFLKMNESELYCLAKACNCAAEDFQSTLCSLASDLGVETLCITRGAKPATMLWEGHVFTGGTMEVKVCDTVGAGDAFFSSMIDSVMHPGFDPVAALTRASSLGSWVASKQGAQPVYDKSVPGLIYTKNR